MTSADNALVFHVPVTAVNLTSAPVGQKRYVSVGLAAGTEDDHTVLFGMMIEEFEEPESSAAPAIATVT